MLAYCQPFQDHVKLVAETPAPWPAPPCAGCAEAAANMRRAVGMRKAANAMELAADKRIAETHPPSVEVAP